ncbi:hypothetical protein D3C78_1556090 [compost metagenome]
MAFGATTAHDALAWLSLAVTNLFGNGLGVNWPCVIGVRVAPCRISGDLFRMTELANGKVGKVDGVRFAVLGLGHKPDLFLKINMPPLGTQ